jgi:hypothetical protein
MEHGKYQIVRVPSLKYWMRQLICWHGTERLYQYPTLAGMIIIAKQKPRQTPGFLSLVVTFNSPPCAAPFFTRKPCPDQRCEMNKRGHKFSIIRTHAQICPGHHGRLRSFELIPLRVSVTRLLFLETTSSRCIEQQELDSTFHLSSQKNGTEFIWLM